MKKLLTLVIVAIAMVGLFGCENNNAKVTEEVFNEAVDMVYEYNKFGENNQLIKNIERAKVIEYEGFTFNVEWTVDWKDSEVENQYVTVEPKDDQFVTIRVNKYVTKDVELALKATVTCGDFSRTLSFPCMMKKFVLANWEYWKENPSGVTMNIKGVIVGKDVFNATNKNTGVYLADLDGEHGYYAYRLGCTADQYKNDLAIGNVVEITGTTSAYNGFREMGSGCTYTLVYDDNGNLAKGDVTPFDLTEKVTSGANLDQYQGLRVALKGFKVKSISIATPLDKDTNKGSANIVLEKDGKTITTRCSTSNTYEYDALAKTLEELKVGYTVDAVGVVAWYGQNANVYPVGDCYTILSTEVTNDDKIATVEKEVSIVKEVTENTDVVLPSKGTAYEEVAINWEVKSGAENAEIKDGKLVITMPKTSAKVVLAATFTCGDKLKVVEYTINLTVGEKTQKEIVDAAYALEAGAALEGTQTLTGVITKIDTPYSESYKNITVTIVVENLTDKPIQCFRLKGEGAATLAEGDTITVSGTIKNYNGTVEFDSGCSLDKVVKKGEENKEVEELLKAAYALEAGAALEGTKTLTGVITKIDTPYSEQYKNITVTIVVEKFTQYPIQCFRLKGEGAATLVEGDTITVSGTIKNYNGTVEFDSGCSLDKVVKKGEENKEVEELLKAAYALEAGAALEGTQTLTGVIITVDTPYSESYKNVTVTIVVEKFTQYPIQCFRLKGEGADTLAKGDTITVSGTIKNYNGTIEFDSGCSLDKVVKGDPIPEPAGTKYTWVSGSGTFGSEDKPTLTLDCGDFIIVLEQNSSTTPTVNDKPEFRMYKGSRVTITAKNGKKITAVTFDDVQKKATEVNELTEGVTANLNNITWTFTAKDGVESLSWVNTAQMRFTEIYVTLA